MAYKRKAKHEYWEFTQDVQEQYLCIRFQLGFHKAGRYLMEKQRTRDLLAIAGTLGIALAVHGMIFDSLKEHGLIK